MPGFGIQKRGTSPLLVKRKKFEGGGSATEDMSSIHEGAESAAEEARETKLEKKGYKETKSGKMVKDFAKGVKEGVKKVAKAPFDTAEKIVNSKTFKELQKQVRDVNIGKFDKEIFYKKFAKGGQAKVSKVMREFGKGKLHSGKKGPVVKSRKQAIAIALSEAGKSKKK